MAAATEAAHCEARPEPFVPPWVCPCAVSGKPLLPHAPPSWRPLPRPTHRSHCPGLSFWAHPAAPASMGPRLWRADWSPAPRPNQKPAVAACRRAARARRSRMWCAECQGEGNPSGSPCRMGPRSAAAAQSARRGSRSLPRRWPPRRPVDSVSPTWPLGFDAPRAQGYGPVCSHLLCCRRVAACRRCWSPA